MDSLTQPTLDALGLAPHVSRPAPTLQTLSCLNALREMVRSYGMEDEALVQMLLIAGIPPYASADDWPDGLLRAQTVITHPRWRR